MVIEDPSKCKRRIWTTDLASPYHTWKKNLLIQENRVVVSKEFG